MFLGDSLFRRIPHAAVTEASTDHTPVRKIMCGKEEGDLPRSFTYCAEPFCNRQCQPTLLASDLSPYIQSSGWSSKRLKCEACRSVYLLQRKITRYFLVNLHLSEYDNAPYTTAVGQQGITEDACRAFPVALYVPPEITWTLQTW